MMKFEEEVMMMMMMENNAEEFGEGSSRRTSPQIISKRKRTKRRAGVCVSVSSTEVEEEDMANCLILLARSGCRRRSLSNDDDVNFDESSASEIRKLNNMETESWPSLIASGVNSYVVYECKSFQSFQAFGGHRASHHKKPHSLFPDDHTTKVKPPTAKTSALLADNKQPSPATLESSSKVHECSICGSAFSSGQALGGHMRRHRTITVAAATNDRDNYRMGAAAAAAAADVDAELAQTGKVASVLVSDRYIRNDNNISNNFLASLDLNLPAPAEEGLDEDQMSHSQRRRLFAATVQGSDELSTTAPPLVGCYF